MGPEDQELELGMDIIFRCESIADDMTPTSVEWYQNGDRLYEEEGKIIIKEDYSLRIITRYDADGGKAYTGEFMCIVTNGYSSAKATAVLTMLTGPEERARKFREIHLTFHKG